MQSVGKDVQDTVTSATTSCVPDTLLDYGVPERLHARLPPPAVVRAVDADGNDVPLKAVRFAGEAFSDGSLLSPQPRGARRGGWAAIGVSADGKVQHRIFGTCPDRFPSAYRAELRGVLAVLQRAVSALSITLDCLSVVDAFGKGRDVCCSSRKRAADLWRAVWREVCRLGGSCEVQLRWCKGHATDQDVASGRTAVRPVGTWPIHHSRARSVGLVGLACRQQSLLQHWPTCRRNSATNGKPASILRTASH